MTLAALALAALLSAPGAGESDSIEALLEAGDFEAAAAALEGSLADPGGGTESALLLSECYLQMRLPEKAAGALALAPPALRAEPRYSYCMAEVLASRGETVEAEKLLEKAVGASTDFRSAFRLAVLLYERGAYQRVEKILARRAGGESPDYYCAIYRARSLLALDRPSEAIEALSVLHTARSTPEVHYLMGRANYLLAKYSVAAGHFRRALGEDKAYLEAAFSLSLALRRAGDKEDADAALGNFVKLQKADRSRLRRANLLSQKCRREPASVDAWVEAGEFQLSTGDSDQAQSHAWKALSLSPRQARARLLLARALRQSGAYGQAALHYRKVISQAPGNKIAEDELREMIRKHARQ